VQEKTLRAIMAVRFPLVALALSLIVAAAEEAAEEVEDNSTGDLIKTLTIGMATETIDERTFILRDMRENTTRKRVLMRLGNVAPIEQAGLSDEEYEKKKETAKKALEETVMKQMVWWKAAADEHQPKPAEGENLEDVPVLVDVWLTNGIHVNTLHRENGHVVKVEEYVSEDSRNILSANSQEEKKKSYEELAEAMKENEEYRRQLKEEAKKEAEASIPAEPIGVGSWLGLATVLVIILGVATNFGRGNAKGKVNMNRKKGFFEKMMSKVKGA